MSHALFSALLSLLFLASPALAASPDLSGRWWVSYEVDSGPGEWLANGSMLSLSEKGAAVQGRAGLGSRGDGYLIGSFSECAFQAAITFRHNPTMFVRLTGIINGSDLQGNFTATKSDGGFSQGLFHASRLTTGTGDVVNPASWTGPVSYSAQDEDLSAKPTEYLDPEANWRALQEGGAKEVFVISYRKNTIRYLSKCSAI
jgi:hypothetical protein